MNAPLNQFKRTPVSRLIKY